MEITNMDKNKIIGRVPTLEELNYEMKKYDIILDENVIRYLQSLLDLEISALRKDILSEEERKMLSEISLYRKATMYNIYHRAMELIEKQKEKYRISIINNDNDYEGIIVHGITSSSENFNVFDYHYAIEKPYISLYEYITDQTKREKEMESILDELEYLYEEINPYHRINSREEWFKWKTDHDRRVYDLEQQYALLDKRREMSSEEQYKAEMQNYFSDIFEKDFGICPKKDYIDTSKRTFSYERKSNIRKELRCDYPTLTLKKEVKYY